MFCRQASKNHTPVPNHSSTSSLLEKTCDLIKNFQEYFDVVVSVARKTDGRHWADLFSAAGRSTEYVSDFVFITCTLQQRLRKRMEKRIFFFSL